MHTHKTDTGRGTHSGGRVLIHTTFLFLFHPCPDEQVGGPAGDVYAHAQADWKQMAERTLGGWHVLGNRRVERILSAGTHLTAVGELVLGSDPQGSWKQAGALGPKGTNRVLVLQVCLPPHLCINRMASNQAVDRTAPKHIDACQATCQECMTLLTCRKSQQRKASEAWLDC